MIEPYLRQWVKISPGIIRIFIVFKFSTDKFSHLITESFCSVAHHRQSDIFIFKLRAELSHHNRCLTIKIPIEHNSFSLLGQWSVTRSHRNLCWQHFSSEQFSLTISFIAMVKNRRKWNIFSKSCLYCNYWTGSEINSYSFTVRH